MGVAETSANATSFSIQSNLWDCGIVKSEIRHMNGNAWINSVILKLAVKYRASHKSFGNVQGICCLVNLACWIGSFVEWAFIGFLSNIATLWSVLISYIFTALPWDASKSYMCLFNFKRSLFECVCMHVWMWQWRIQLLPGQIEVFFLGLSESSPRFVIYFIITGLTVTSQSTVVLMCNFLFLHTYRWYVTS